MTLPEFYAEILTSSWTGGSLMGSKCSHHKWQSGRQDRRAFRELKTLINMIFGIEFFYTICNQTIGNS